MTDVWLAFSGFVLVLLLVDLGLSRRKLAFREAAWRSAGWIALGLLVNLAVWGLQGDAGGLQYSTAYLLEESLSVDNLFVFLLIFRYFQVPESLQHHVLTLGVLGAMLLRGLVILAGITLVGKWDFVLHLFAALLIYSGFKLGTDDEEMDLEQNPMVRLCRRCFPVTPEYHGQSFFVRLDGKLFATPLLIVLVALETSDLLFAMDSIPAVFGVSRDHFIVFASNIMAILGLRAIYFTLAGLMGMFRYLRYGLSAILVLVGVRMLLRNTFVIPLPWTLGLIFTALLLAVLASLTRVWGEQNNDRPHTPSSGGPA